MDVFHGDWRAPKASRPIITVVATATTSRDWAGNNLIHWRSNNYIGFLIGLFILLRLLFNKLNNIFDFFFSN